MASEPSEKIERLESHLAHLERQLEVLNEVVVGQSRELERLRTQLQRLTRSLEALELDRIKATNPKPPHYQ